MKESELKFDRKKHSIYPKTMGKKIKCKLEADYGKEKGGQLWEQTTASICRISP